MVFFQQRRQRQPLGSKIRQTVLATLLGLSTFAAPAQAGLNEFKTALNTQMDSLLQQEVKRSLIGFEGSWKGQNNSCERCGSYTLEVPSHVQRDTVLNVTLSFQNQQPVLKGQVLTEAERKLLVKLVGEHLGKPVDQLDTFPFNNIKKSYAIASQPAVDLYVKPQAVAGENLATQMRLGTPVKILAYSPDQRFAKVQVEDDGYIAWVERKNLLEGEASWYQDWLKHRSVVVMHEVQKPVKLYYGTRLKLIKQSSEKLEAALPNGQKVSLNSADVIVQQPGPLPSAEKILGTARQFLPKGPFGGGDYLWGGTLGKRLDCSGFVQTVYRVNGVFLPRDADQQKGFTQRVGNTLKQLNELKPGDLVFFSGNGKYPTHVGLYLGKGEIIHSSAKGQYNGIKINTLQGGGSYDQYLQSIYFGGGRVTRSL